MQIRRMFANKWLIIGASLVVVVAGFFLFAPATNRTRSHSYDGCRSNLRTLGEVMKYYEKQNGTLPPQYVIKNGHKHSWRVLVLPTLERDDIYRQYRFDEPWDGPNNKKLAEQVGYFNPYRCHHDSTAFPDSTNYFMVAGPDAVFDGERTIRLNDIEAADGLKDTILIVEAIETGIHWMEPRDLSFDDINRRANDPIAWTKDVLIGKEPSSYHNGYSNALFADGSVQVLGADAKPKELRALITYRGGEKINLD